MRNTFSQTGFPSAQESKSTDAMNQHMKKTLFIGKRLALAAVGGVVAMSLPSFAMAGEGDKKPAPEIKKEEKKPTWLTDFSMGIKESVDTNVYVTSVDAAPVAGQDGRFAKANYTSMITTFSPKIGVNFAPLIGSDYLKVLSLGYAPDYSIFHDASSETNYLHKFTAAAQGKMDFVSFNIENSISLIDGSDEGLIYTGPAATGNNSAFANAATRERRKQWQDRTKAWIKADIGSFFIRPTFSLAYYDLETKQKNIAGYTNYVDRYDINGGVDVGYNIMKDLALTVGYRYGYQNQDALPWNVTSASNNYHRILFGAEGSPFKWLKFEGVVGPEFKTYTNNRPVQPTALVDQSPTDYYAEANISLIPTKEDTITFKCKRWNWVASTGTNPYLDSAYELNYKRKITKELQFEIGGKAAQADYNPATNRNDWQYTFLTGFRYAFNEHFSADIGYQFDRGHNQQVAGLPTDQIRNAREFDRNIFSFGI